MRNHFRIVSGSGTVLLVNGEAIVAESMDTLYNLLNREHTSKLQSLGAVHK